MFVSEFTEVSNNAETRADLLVLVQEGTCRGLQIHSLAEGQVRPTGLAQVLDFVRVIVGCHCVGNKLKVIVQRTASPARDGSAQPQSSRHSAVDGAGTLSDLVSFRRLLLWLLIHVATACMVTLPHPGRLPRSL